MHDTSLSAACSGIDAPGTARDIFCSAVQSACLDAGRGVTCRLRHLSACDWDCLLYTSDAADDM
eukprot:6266524-Alexandrium_andersonii.AAC.1